MNICASLDDAMKSSASQKRSCNYKRTTKTLDYCHKHNIEEFAKDKERVEELEAECDEVEREIAQIEQKHSKECSDEELLNIVHLRDRRESLRGTVEAMRRSTNEINYFVNTSDILYNYYNLVENNTDEGNNPRPSDSTGNQKSIIDYFKVPTAAPADPPCGDDKGPDVVKLPRKTEKNRAALLDEYLSYTDDNYINNNIDNKQALQCEHCKCTEKTVLYNDSIYFCNKCFSIQNLLTDNEKPSYKDPPKEISYFSYKRINHYQEWLNQIQGKETTDIPDEIFDRIMLELKKQRITNVQELNRRKVKDILKKLRINKYYEHIPYILNRITGIPNPNLTQDLEEKLRNMFKEIQVPFLKHSPLNRKNFLSYSYVIHKFIQLLKKDEYLKYFPLLKSRDKLHQQEQIWKNICQDLGWTFIRSI